MATELKKFEDAYASMVLATYEPLILKWVSGFALCNLASALASRLNTRPTRNDGRLSTSQQLVMDRRVEGLPNLPKKDPKLRSKGLQRPLSNTSRPLDEKGVTPVHVEGFPEALEFDGKIFLHGLMDAEFRFTADKLGLPIDSGFTANPHTGLRQVPIVINRNFGKEANRIPFQEAFKKTYVQLLGAAEAAVSKKENLAVHLDQALKKIGDAKGYHLFPFRRVEEALSPIGIAHYYRQLYFNVQEGTGPVEQAFTIAPLETFEVVYQTVMRRIHEESMETGMETTTESSVEERNSEEISDKVSSMIQRDTSASMSAEASGTIGVWSVGATASGDFSTSSERSREQTSRRVQEITKRASERIHKTFSLRTKDTNDFTTTNLQKRVIQNNSPSPVSYGLRRVFRKVRVKVQDLGPKLVWQVYIPNPGEGLARSKFVLYRESDPIAVPEIPPGVRPRPEGGTDTGSTSSALHWDTARQKFFVTLVINTGSDRDITALSIDNITDLDGGGKNDEAPSPMNDQQWGAAFDPGKKTFTVNIGINAGDSSSVSVAYTYSWSPSVATLAAWEAEVAAARTALKEQALNEQFEKQKNLITAKSKIPKRPANDLRMEERYEVMNRMVSLLFAQGIDPSQPNPLEIEFFHRYFDIQAMFVYNHPSWWRPRYTSGATGLARSPYEITDESDPAPLGSSLGWAIQLDGDDRRNEFINSPWVRVCLPIKPGLERDAVDWLARHIEGQVGYDSGSGQLSKLLETIEELRAKEEKLGVNGPNYVTVSSSPSAPGNALTPQDIYPIIDEFEVSVPTEGFVYDELKLV
jgi:hypothetical protein